MRPDDHKPTPKHVKEPTRARRYKLAELLAQCIGKRRMVRADREWLDSKPVGRELI